MSKPSTTASRLFEVFSSGRDSLRQQDETVRIRVHVGSGAPRALVSAVRDALVAERAGGVVDVRPVMSVDAAEPRQDAVLIVCGESMADVTAPIRGYAGQGIPVALVAEGALDAPEPPRSADGSPLADLVCASSAEQLVDSLGSWLARSVANKIALAANFPVCRKAVVDALISRCALDNAALGVVSLVPGSDFPLMTAREAKLAIDIACCYGGGVEPSRVLELAGVLGMGYALRASGRGLSSLVPSLANLVKGGVAYGGSRLVGEAMRLRFEGLPQRKKKDEKDPVPATNLQTLAPNLPSASDYLVLR